MKKLIISIIFILFLFSFSITSFANSGPVYWQGYPSSDIMSIEENSPIKVKSENLEFDFSNNSNSDFTICGEVTASYIMANQANETKKVQMAFPFIGRLDDISADDIAITANGNVVPYKVYVGNRVRGSKNQSYDNIDSSFQFDNIVSTITDELYSAYYFKQDEKGKLYTIDVEPTTGQRINFAAHFSFDYLETKVITSGFNRYERNDKRTRIASWCREKETLEILVLGKDINLKMNAYTDGELKKNTDLYTYDITTKEVELKEYLLEYVRKHTNIEENLMINDTQLYNLYAKILDKRLIGNKGFCSEYDIIEQENYNRIITLVYEVSFPKKSEQEVSVSYKTVGTMDKTETVKPKYTFNYILNPAKNWKNFNDLYIKIITSDKVPYIVKSNIELVKEGNKLYSAKLTELPEEDFSFTLYSDKSISLLDKAGRKIYRKFGYITPIVIGLVILLVVILFKIIINRKRIKK